MHINEDPGEEEYDIEELVEETLDEIDDEIEQIDDDEYENTA